MVSLPSLLKPPASSLPSSHHPKQLFAYSSPSVRLSSKPKRTFQTCGCFSASYPNFFVLEKNDDPQDLVDDHVVGDCLIFEEGAFDDPFLTQTASVSPSGTISSPSSYNTSSNKFKNSKKKSTKRGLQAESLGMESLIPDEWSDALTEINLTKKERRQLAREIEFNSRVEKKKQAYLPLRSLELENYQAYNEAKLAHLKPAEVHCPLNESDEDEDIGSKRVAPKDPRWAVYGKGIEDVREILMSQNDDTSNKSKGSRKLFTVEEKALLNQKLPDLSAASSRKWLPLHAFAASGELTLISLLLKHNAEINAADSDGFTALHKAIFSKKQAVTRHLLKESANPFVIDKDGATLMHYAVQTASVSAIKYLLLYNVDINVQDKDGWTPLHVAVQTRRTDVLKLLLIRGADKSLKNSEGLTPLDLCLHSGRNTRTYEMIKLLKQLPKPSIVPARNRSRKSLSSSRLRR